MPLCIQLATHMCLCVQLDGLVIILSFVRVGNKARQAIEQWQGCVVLRVVLLWVRFGWLYGCYKALKACHHVVSRGMEKGA